MIKWQNFTTINMMNTTIIITLHKHADDTISMHNQGLQYYDVTTLRYYAEFCSQTSHITDDNAAFLLRVGIA